MFFIFGPVRQSTQSSIRMRSHTSQRKREIQRPRGPPVNVKAVQPKRGLRNSPPGAPTKEENSPCARPNWNGWVPQPSYGYPSAAPTHGDRGRRPWASGGPPPRRSHREVQAKEISAQGRQWPPVDAPVNQQPRRRPPAIDPTSLTCALGKCYSGA